MLRISIREAAGEDVLHGSVAGRRCLERLLREIWVPAEPQEIYLDFVGISAATVSYLRDGPLAFRRVVRQTIPTLYPVIANANPAVFDALSDYLASTNDAIFACDLVDDRVSGVVLVGALEPKQRVAFELAQAREVVTASSLASDPTANPDGVSVNAWNNRLAALSEKGLLIARYSGRAKVYTPTMRG